MRTSRQILQGAINSAKAHFGEVDLDFKKIGEQSVFPEFNGRDKSIASAVYFFLGPRGSDPSDESKWLKFRWA